MCNHHWESVGVRILKCTLCGALLIEPTIQLTEHKYREPLGREPHTHAEVAELDEAPTREIVVSATSSVVEINDTLENGYRIWWPGKDST